MLSNECSRELFAIRVATFYERLADETSGRRECLSVPMSGRRKCLSAPSAIPQATVDHCIGYDSLEFAISEYL